jgi:hypothetical protein
MLARMLARQGAGLTAGFGRHVTLTNERTPAGVLSQVYAPQICSSEPGFATTMPSLLYGRVADNGCQRHAEASGIHLR